MTELNPHLRLAGFALAHALWSVEYGDTLCTMAMLESDGERTLTRYEADSIPESIEGALGDLKERLTPTSFAALIYDGYYTPEDGGERRDALIVELLRGKDAAVTGNDAEQTGRIAQQYVPGRSALLRKTRVKLAGKPYLIGPLPPDAVDAVIEGAMEHEKARDLFATL
jgi:hypothetical protein